MKKKMSFFIVILMCGTLCFTGCNTKTAVETSEPSKEPTLKELATVFKDVDLKYYISAINKAF